MAIPEQTKTFIREHPHYSTRDLAAATRLTTKQVRAVQAQLEADRARWAAREARRS